MIVKISHTAQSTQSTLLLCRYFHIRMPGAGEAAEAGGHQQCKLQLILAAERWTLGPGRLGAAASHM